MSDLAHLARIVDEAARTATAIAQLSLEHPDLSVADACEIQRLSFARRLQRGEQRIGIKMGLTSRAKMIQVNVDEVIWGRLSNAMVLEEGGALSLQNYVHPRIEPEIAFLLKKPLGGTVTALQAQAAVEAIAPAMEVIDSRYENFKFSLADVIADNSSSSGLVIGPWARPDQDFSNLGMVMQVNGRPVQIGSSAAILGHPIRSLVSAAAMVARAGESLQPGDIVMAGGATAAHPLAVGEHVHLTVQNLGNVMIGVET